MNIVTIDGTKHAKCEMCGKEDQLRPYGPNGESVCFNCGMKDEEAAERQFAKLINGSDLVVIIRNLKLPTNEKETSSPDSLK